MVLAVMVSSQLLSEYHCALAACVWVQISSTLFGASELQVRAAAPFEAPPAALHGWTRRQAVPSRLTPSCRVDAITLPEVVLEKLAHLADVHVTQLDLTALAEEEPLVSIG